MEGSKKRKFEETNNGKPTGSASSEQLRPPFDPLAVATTQLVNFSSTLCLTDHDSLVLVFLLLSWYWLLLVAKRSEMIRENNLALTGHEYTQELLHGSSTLCQEMMRISREAYVSLCNHFKQKNWLQSCGSISVEEKLAMFLTTIGHNDRSQIVKRKFQHSTKTIHTCFLEVLDAMMDFAREIIVPTSSDATANTSERHRRLKEIFPGAIGALDGILVPAVVPNEKQNLYKRNGQGECYQNVLGICDFDMVFTFVWAGWEGSAHDSHVLKKVAFSPTSNFPFPPSGKYYLCDSAYTNTRGFMTPYRNTRYSLADFQRQPAVTKEERFNHAHAQLRNVIERAYGVLNARFPILKQMAPYSFTVQSDIVIACFAVHNFIRKGGFHDQLFVEFEEDSMFTGEVEGGESDGQSKRDLVEWGLLGNEYMANLRDQIADQLFSNALN